MKQQNDERTEKRFLTVKEMAEYLRIGIVNAYKLVREPDFPAVKILVDSSVNMVSRIIPKDKLDQWVEERIGKV